MVNRLQKILLLIVLSVIAIQISGCLPVLPLGFIAELMHGMGIGRQCGVEFREVDRVGGIVQTSDGGYVFVADNNISDEFRTELFIIKLDSKGNTQWKAVRSREGYSIRGNSIIQTSDDGYLAAGDVGRSAAYISDPLDPYKNIFLLKLDAAGREEWKKVIGKEFVGESAYCVRQTSDGGFVLAGEVSREIMPFHSYGIVMKLDAAGKKVWEKTLGNKNEGMSTVYSVLELDDGGYIAAGQRETNSGSGYYGVVCRLDAAGGRVWEQNFATVSGAWITGRTTEGNFIVVSPEQVALVDENGSTFWVKKVPGIREKKSWGERISDAAPTPGGGIVFSCTRMWDEDKRALIKIIKLDRSGKEIWTRKYDYRKGELVAGYLANTKDGGYVLSGLRAESRWQNLRGFVMKLDSEGRCEW